MKDPSKTQEPVALVMDLGGNWIRVALANEGGELVWRERAATRAQEGATGVISRVEDLLHQAISRAEDRELVGIGIGVASPVDPGTGTMYSPPNLQALDGVSFKALWEEKMPCPIRIGNDATLAALGEYRYGEGVGAHTLVYMTISTGIGGGVVIQGRPMTGAYGMAGELGHMSVDPAGPRCQCGNVGCLERIASGTAIADTARRQIQMVGSSMIGDMVSGDLDRITAGIVFEAASKGDQLARQILENAARALGAGLVNILHILNPDVIVIGGGVSNNWEYWRPTVESYIQNHAMDHVLKKGFKLGVSSLGDDIGLLGAAALVWQR